MVSFILSLKRSTRFSLITFVDGNSIGSIFLRVARSIEDSIRFSRGATNKIASPSRPARPVRPIRCT